MKEWIDCFPIAAYVSDTIDYVYCTDDSQVNCQEKPHKEEGHDRRKLDAGDRRLISEELNKHSHPLEVDTPVLYNIVNGQVAPNEVNVSDSRCNRPEDGTYVQAITPIWFSC